MFSFVPYLIIYINQYIQYKRLEEDCDALIICPFGLFELILHVVFFGIIGPFILSVIVLFIASSLPGDFQWVYFTCGFWFWGVYLIYVVVVFLISLVRK